MTNLRIAFFVIWLVLGMAASPVLGAANYLIHSPGITVKLARDGKIIEVVLGKKKIVWRMLGETHLAGCQVKGPVESLKGKDGKIEFKKRLACDEDGVQREVGLTEDFFATTDSVRWQMQLDGVGAPWSTPIETKLSFPKVEDNRFWTTWADPQPEVLTGTEDWRKFASDVWSRKRLLPKWNDPLVPMPFVNRTFWYGAPYYQCDRSYDFWGPLLPDLFSVPLATVVRERDDAGVSFVLSPEDTLLDLTLETSASGDVTFSRVHRRISETAPVQYTVNLVPHEGDWRGGLRWMVAHYPQYFEPPLPEADQISGTATYADTVDNLDVEKLKQMAFHVYWTTGDEAAYQGMFLPNVANDDEEWKDMDGILNSNRRMAEHAHRLHEMGFCVLDYLNAEGFGVNISYPPPPPEKGLSDFYLWKDPNTFLHTKLQDAIIPFPRQCKPRMEQPPGKLLNPGDPYVDCGVGAPRALLDCGEPVYQHFLLDQVRKMMAKIPDSDGVAIDRLDWMRIYNDRRDDGVSWFDGPARALVSSWKDFLSQLGALLHPEHKVVFVNPHVRRLDMLRDVDGIFDEHGHFPFALNTTAFIGIDKPTIGWVSGEKDLRPDPDAFLQRYLYLGIFPEAPFPKGDHSIRSSPWADQQYLNYGPMFEAMRGRKWVLLPHVVSIEGGTGKANVFRVPSGYIIPVVFGGSASELTVKIRGLTEMASSKGLRCEVIQPGSPQWTECSPSAARAVLTLRVPLSRGCAMVRLRND